MSINIFTKNFLTFLKIVLVLVIPVQIVTVIVLVSTIDDPDLLTRPGTTSSGTISSDDQTAFIGGQVVVIVLALVLAVIATAACFKAVGDAYLGVRPDWKESLKFAVRRFHSVLWIGFLIALALFAAGFLVAVIGGIIGALIGLGAVLFFIWLLFAWSAAVPAMLFEDVRGTGALKRSFGLVRGRWWKTMATIFVAWLFAIIVGGILQTLVGALAFTDAGDSVLGVALLNALASGVGQIFTTPVPAAVIAVVYFDLRVRKEGFDLQLMAERLGVTPGEFTGVGNAGEHSSPIPAAGSDVPVWERQASAAPAPPPPPPPQGE